MFTSVRAVLKPPQRHQTDSPSARNCHTTHLASSVWFTAWNCLIRQHFVWQVYSFAVSYHVVATYWPTAATLFKTPLVLSTPKQGYLNCETEPTKRPCTATYRWRNLNNYTGPHLLKIWIIKYLELVLLHIHVCLRPFYKSNQTHKHIHIAITA